MVARTYERLTGLDSAFIYAESANAPLHIASIAILDGGPLLDEDGTIRVDEIRRHIASRLHLVPRLRKKLQDVPLRQGRPVWIDDTDFRIENHVHVVTLDPPGSERQLLDRCAELLQPMLRRDRPLWEVWLVGGLPDGKLALVERVHHAMADGVSGVEVAAALLDLEPEPAGDVQPPSWEPRRGPRAAQLLVESMWATALEPAAVLRRARSALRVPSRALSTLAEIGGAGTTLARPGVIAPRSTLNRPVGPNRQLHVVRQSLAEVKDIAHAHGSTVNDVVLAAVAGGVRELLQARHEDADDVTLQVLVPVSLRGDADHDAQGNRVAGLLAPLPVREAEPLDRLRAVAEAVGALKSHHQEEATELLVGAASLLHPTIIAALSRLLPMQPFVNLVVTNIPGPDVPLYFDGALMLDSIPVVPLAGNLTVGVAVLSYNGQITIGINTDVDAVPDAVILAEGIERGFDELRAAEAQVTG